MKFRILCIEDTPTDQTILNRSLRKNMPIDFDLTIAETAMEGLRKIEQDQFDLIILDYQLPCMTGLDFLEELRKRQTSIPIIFMTGQGSEKVAVEAMKLGVRDYIVKDEIGSPRLADTIRKIVLGSTLPSDVDVETVAHIAALFSESPVIKMEILKTLRSEPKSEIPPARLVSTMRKLEEMGAVEAKPSRSVVACPSCSSVTAVLHLQCPECGSVKLHRGEALEHLSCGCVDFRSKFDKGEGKVICPKCEKRLRMVGVDYRIVDSWYKCSDDHFFGRPVLTFRCSECEKVFSLDTTVIKTLNRYQLTEYGRRLLRLGLLRNEFAEETEFVEEKYAQAVVNEF